MDECAVSLFADTTFHFAAHRPETTETLVNALVLDPELPAAHALQGFINVLQGRAGPALRACEISARLDKAIQGRRATAFEIRLCESLRLAAGGQWRGAADRLEAADAARPDLLSFKLAHALRFMAGDQAGMLHASARALRTWDESAPGYGFVLGCHAFVLGESGESSAAERMARQALAHQPDDVWAQHALAHVFETGGRLVEGIAWLEQTRSSWSHANNFRFHMSWHLALLHLTLGRQAKVLELYDREIYPQPSSDFRDIANAISLLWRLRQDGVDVGDRLAVLAEGARQRIGDTQLVFASLHDLLALLAFGDAKGARQLIDRLRLCAASPSDQGRVARDIGIPLAEALESAHAAGMIGAEFGRLTGRMQQLGGSHAQRDVFLRTLIGFAADAGAKSLAQKLLAFRHTIRSQDRFSRAVLARLHPHSQTFELKAHAVA
ncbi:tetratricopeptide repeat protein [Roseiarcaceae bacterium H3SJ34-1]|uniref:tetratricopeptide repeat protein n=1 Tax=Terripilifer ovatus TaxID=3032367 RepID=UPI003AB93E42|nr:tetratricopeptide repeat protein [Roseiarcaceae bacterium H3SJ34-1]